MDETVTNGVSPKRPQNETIEQQVTRECQQSILAAYERLAKLANLPAEVRSLPVSRLHDVACYF